MAGVGFLGLGFLFFFNLTQTNKSPRVGFFSALVTQVRQTQKNSKKYKNIFQSFSSMNEDSLHHPEPEKPDSGPASKKRAGRHTSSLWELFI